MTPEGTTLTVAAPGTIGNDYDPDGDTFLMTGFTTPANGQITSAVTSGAFTYVPNPGFTGTDAFTYVLRDDDDVFSMAGTVTIHVLAPPDATPPVITTEDPLVLWPPNGQYRTIRITDLVRAVTDAGSPALSARDVVITQVSSDENAMNGPPGPDIVINDACTAVDLRAVAAGNGNGRVYVIDLAVADAGGNVGTASVEVRVPATPRSTAVRDAPVLIVPSACGS